MIKLRLVRKPTTPTFTEGDLYVNGEWWAYTLEDALRTGPKIHGKTAIPAGKYPIAATMSTRFGKVMTEIQSVPGFKGVRIHQGLSADDTLGCVLISKRRGNEPGHLAAMVKGQMTDELTKMVKDGGGGEILIINS